MKSTAGHFPMLLSADIEACTHRWNALQVCLRRSRSARYVAEEQMTSWEAEIERETEQRLLQLRSYREALKHSAKWDRSRAKAK